MQPLNLAGYTAAPWLVRKAREKMVSKLKIPVKMAAVLIATLVSDWYPLEFWKYIVLILMLQLS